MAIIEAIIEIFAELGAYFVEASNKRWAIIIAVCFTVLVIVPTRELHDETDMTSRPLPLAVNKRPAPQLARNAVLSRRQTGCVPYRSAMML